jgi:hypothetical protein
VRLNGGQGSSLPDCTSWAGVMLAAYGLRHS